jgi:hypothetical protein
MITYLAIEAFGAIKRFDMDEADFVVIGCRENFDVALEYLSCIYALTLLY